MSDLFLNENVDNYFYMRFTLQENDKSWQASNKQVPFFQKEIAELSQELDSLRAMNSSFQAYLEHLQGFKRNLAVLSDSYTQLSKVNGQWIDLTKMLKWCTVLLI